MMKLREIFKKPVDRAIEGVIKADDEASLRVELEEYVITNEIEQAARKVPRRLQQLRHGQRGLDFRLLRLREIAPAQDAGAPAREPGGRWEPRPTSSSSQNARIMKSCAADLRHAVSIPSKSILFNIDQKADVISKAQIDALLSVFQKVFDEMCGYYGKQPHIAQFERDLDSRGVLPGVQGCLPGSRRQALGTRARAGAAGIANIAKAYAQATGADVRRRGHPDAIPAGIPVLDRGFRRTR